MHLSSLASSALSEASSRAQAGDLAGARAIYLSLVDQPELTAFCLYQLGLIAGSGGQHGRAAGLVAQALSLKADLWEAYPVLMAALERCGRHSEAHALPLQLGCALENAGEHARAAEVFRQVLDQDPLNYAACCNLGHCLVRMKRAQDAAPYLLQAIRLCARVYPELASLLAWLEPRLQSASFSPPYLLPEGLPSGLIDKRENALTSLGTALSDAGDVEAAIHCHRAAIAVAPDYALAHWNLSLCLLYQNHWQEGWQEYEWRWRWPECPEPPRRLPVLQWQGENLQGKHVLVWTEQGLGDAMQFVPLAQRLQQMGAHVTLEAPSSLHRLFANSFADFSVVDRPNHPDILSAPMPVDYVIPLMSLAQRLKLRPESLPLATHYLQAPAADIARWTERLKSSGKPRVGFIWAGNTNQMPWQFAREMFEESGIAWYALQLGPAQAALAEAALPQVFDLSSELRDFADTAAAISQLDLLISIDTGVAHLAGAMGKPVWVMVDHLPNWRWNAVDDRCPWYPSMRLFRRAASESWQAVITRTAEALRGWRDALPH